MTVTIHSILNTVLWGSALAVALSLLSRNRRFLYRFGVAPLAVLSAACLLRCCLPVELTVTKEVGAGALNRLHKLIDRAAGSPTPEPWILGIWLAGTVLGLAVWLPRYIIRLRAVKRLPNATDSRVQRFCREQNLCGLRIVITPKAPTPCVIGFWHETVLLPETNYTNKQLDLILRHEYVHIQHHDGLLDCILCFLCILFWWNPGVLICRVVIVRLCDHRCDTETLRSTSPSAKRYYCRTLLAFAARYSSPTRQFAAASLKSRFYLILYEAGETKRARFLLIVGIIIVLLVASYLVILQPAFQPEEPEYQAYAVHEATVTENPDGSYTIHTESGDYNLSASEIAGMDREQFPVQNTEGDAIP